MHQVFIDIILDAIIEQYESEEQFFQEYIRIDTERWESWKAGRSNLTAEENQKLKALFTDYEWMLMQKIIRQTVLFPEKRTIAVSEYKRIKTVISKKWLDGGATVELVSRQKSKDESDQQRIDLKVTMAYGEWGFDDIITFRLPSMIRQQIEGSKVELLDWVNENLTDMYVTE